MTKLVSLVCAVGLAACVTEPVDVGELSLDVKTEAGGEGTWRLRNATFVIRSGTTVVDTFVDSSTALAVRRSLAPGDYTIELTGDWKLRLEYQGMSYDAGVFEVASANPAPFTITEGATTPVTFAFKRPGSVAVGIQGPPRRVTATIVAHDHGALEGKRAAITWDMNLSVEGPQKYDQGLERYVEYTASSHTITVAGDPEITSYFANVAPTSALGLATFNGAIDAGASVGLGGGYYLGLNGNTSVPRDAENYPVAAPFCVSDGYFRIENFDFVGFWGEAEWCFE